MNKEAQIVEMADIIALYFKEPIAEPCQYCKSAEALYNGGYRKLPEGKPLLLSDKEANYAVTDAEMAQYSGWDEVQRARQREADIKHYEGVNEH